MNKELLKRNLGLTDADLEECTAARTLERLPVVSDPIISAFLRDGERDIWGGPGALTVRRSVPLARALNRAVRERMEAKG